MIDYKRFIQDCFKIVNKQGELVDFKLNEIQNQYLEQDFTGQDIVLKARQQGFSSLITAMFTSDFLLSEHSYSVIIADNEDNAEGLLKKVKDYIKSYELKRGIKIKLKYNTKMELHNEFMDTTFTIGTAKNQEFGRSKTITNLHCSELAFYPNIQAIIAGAGQAVTETGIKIFETTANGFNQFKTFYDNSKVGETGYKALFYPASKFYKPEFLKVKRLELDRMYYQEYPDTDIEAFMTSGECYFENESLRYYMEHKMRKASIGSGLIYV